MFGDVHIQFARFKMTAVYKNRETIWGGCVLIFYHFCKNAVGK